jgi:anaerobic ribonucleoside-triphosphate reductase activating protein
LANFVRGHYPQIKTAWYSGCANLPNGFNKKSFQYIKLGGYVEELGALNNRTSNQHLFEIQQNGFMKDISYLFRTIN